jgi:hypothetical protein
MDEFWLKSEIQNGHCRLFLAHFNVQMTLTHLPFLITTVNREYI